MISQTSVNQDFLLVTIFKTLLINIFYINYGSADYIKCENGHL